MRKFRVAATAAVVLAAIGVAGAGFVLHGWYADPLPLPRNPYGFEVRSGASLASVARSLRDAGVLPHAGALTWLGRFRSADRTIKAGSYEIEAGITLPQLLDKLTQGDVTQTALTIVEGTTFSELKRVLRENSQVTHDVADLPDGELLARIGASESQPEGLFFPDTYFFATGTSDAKLLKRAYRSLHDRLEAAWSKRAADLPLRNAYEALILASIVEKETGRANDRPLIASVFINRLRRGMRLQTDPSVIYGIGAHFDGNLHKRDLETDSPYNTYMRDGLPPTPIALPSQASIDVVMNPPKSDFLYFVSRGDGTSEFSATLVDHNRAVSKYQKGGR